MIPKKPAQGLTVPENWSKDFNNFVQKCLILDEKQRPSAKELLIHPFVLKTANRATALLSELVTKSFEEVESWRMKRYPEEEEDDEDEYNSGGVLTVKPEGEEVDIPDICGTTNFDAEVKEPEEKPFFMQYLLQQQEAEK